MSNQIRKLKRNNAKSQYDTRDHNFPHKLAAKKRAEAKEFERREKQKENMNLNLE